MDPLYGGYLIPPTGFALPSFDLMVAPGFTWPSVEMPFYGFATFRTPSPRLQHFNRTVATFNGAANPGAGTIVVEARSLVPMSVAPPIEL